MKLWLCKAKHDWNATFADLGLDVHWRWDWKENSWCLRGEFTTVGIGEPFLKQLFNLTDAEIRDDMLAEWTVLRKGDPGVVWAANEILFKNRRIRYGRDEQPQDEAERCLENIEKKLGENDKDVAIKWMARLLLKKEWENE